MSELTSNRDEETISSFGDEWSTYTQSGLSPQELQKIFDSYFGIFPWDELPADATGFDMGCGSGRWARLVAPRVGRLACIDASEEALAVAKRNLAGIDNAVFHHATTETAPLGATSCDFGYSLGVLHHIPDTQAALNDCVSYLKHGAPFLIYLYYRFDNRPAWFRAVWKASELLRSAICRLPRSAKSKVTDLLALIIYLPLARLSLLLEKLGINVSSLPLSAYRKLSFSTMRTDSRDRFGTPLEQRFTREEIAGMMSRAGLVDICFSESVPYWVAVGRKAA